MENKEVTFTVTELAAAAMRLDGPEYKDDFTLRGICLTFYSRLRNDLKAKHELGYLEEYERDLKVLERPGPRLLKPRITP